MEAMTLKVDIPVGNIRMIADNFIYEAGAIIRSDLNKAASFSPDLRQRS